MKVKALLLGALPQPFEGPWVNLEDGWEWEVEAPEELNGACTLHIISRDKASPPRSLGLACGYRVMNAEKVRAVIDKEVQGLALVNVSMRCVHERELS